MTMRSALEIVTPVPITAHRYEELRETEVRIEVVDGLAYVSPSPTPLHQRIVFRLASVLTAACPPEMEVFIGVDVRLGDDPLSVRVPDITVVRGPVGDVLRPEQLVLAVEVVSPGTRTTDTLHKREEYAAAGIPNYWLLDWVDEQLALRTFSLHGGERSYRPGPSAEHGGSFREPYPVSVDLAALRR